MNQSTAFIAQDSYDFGLRDWFLSYAAIAHVENRTGLFFVWDAPISYCSARSTLHLAQQSILLVNLGPVAFVSTRISAMTQQTYPAIRKARSQL